MDEVSARRAEALKRTIYVIVLAVATPVLPLIGWLQRDSEPHAVAVYSALTVAVFTALVGLLTERLSVLHAESVILVSVPTVLLARLAGVALVDPVPFPELRVIVSETLGPTAVTTVLILYLALELRPARRWSLALWAAFSGLIAPRMISDGAADPGAAVALLRQSITVGAVVGLAYALASLRAQLADARARARALDELANTDPLTGIRNRRGSQQALADELARAARYDTSLSIALLDLDRFKDRNDHLGHAAGDEALILVASTLRAELRTADALGRWGGDELLVIAPELDVAHVARSAQRWRQLVGELGLSAGTGVVTTSIGVATYHAGDTADTLLTRADRALYAAKRLGGDRVVTDTGRREVATQVTAGDATLLS